MENIEQMVEQNSERFFSMETFLDTQMKKLLKFEEMMKKISSLEKHFLSKSSAESKDDVRRVLLGKGVCATRNSIRNEEEIREVEFRREIPKQEAYQRKIRDEMRREQETLKHDMEEMRQEKENLQIKYDTEIDRLINMIENVKKREEQYKIAINEKEKKEREIHDEMKRERDEWERQKLEERQRKEEDEKRREREKQTSDERFQRLKSEMEGIIRENERIERERQEQLEEFEKRLKKESEMRENQQHAFKETLKLLEEKQTRRVEWREDEREKEEMKNKICSETNDSLQVIAYRKLESEYSKWSWSLHSAIMKTENKLHNHIENQAICKVDETDLQKELKETSKKVEKSMSEFFEKDKNKDMLFQWKTSCEIKIKELQENIVRETKRKLTEVLQQQELKKKIDVKRTHHENTLYEKSKELALNLKDKISDKDTLNKEFDLFWEQWMRKIITDTGPIEDTDIMRDVREILSDVHDGVPIDHKKWRDIFCVSNYSDYVWLKRFSGLTRILTNVYKSAKENFGDFLSKEDKDQITSFISDVAMQTDTMVQLFDISKVGYNISCIQQLIGYIKRRVTEHQEGPVNYEFKNEFFIDLVYTICNKANKIITDEHRMFMEDNDPLLYLEEKRKEYYCIFQKHLNGATSAAIFGEIICQKLKEPIKQSLYKKTARDLTDEIMINCETLKGNRSKLEKHILKLLAENENFSAYMDYINYPRDHFKSFIRDEVSRYITRKFSASVWPKMKQNIILLQQRIMKASHEFNECFKENSGDVSLWLKSFTLQLSDVLIFSEEDLDGVKHDDVDCKLIKGVIKKVLPHIMSDISREFNIKTFNEKLKFKSKPDEILIDHLCRCCWAQCPFCKATCTNTIENHERDHSVAFHRVRGINGTCYRFTQSLCADICTNLVANDQDICLSSRKISWKEIKITGPKYDMWSIIPGHSVLPYWKWFVCRFQKDLETYYNKTFECEGEIPYEWRTYTKQDAIESLDKYII
ncbi:interferon-induced very large GTPase 1-like [Carassius carassius]|uniref:interferon-induced very large GTPase 1-like n=1 Tax=Carassius carassius TaxID=217509 RepID=UPI002868B95A|nr:interferon-induced very large GTPase 1-like [Carassius carassius]